MKKPIITISYDDVTSRNINVLNTTKTQCFVISE